LKHLCMDEEVSKRETQQCRSQSDYKPDFKAVENACSLGFIDYH